MSDTGVVDPIRIPRWLREPAERWWRELPTVARVFLGLALLDVLVRAIGLVDPIAFGDNILLDVGAVIPRDLWILLPALIVARRPDAATATPSIFLGSIVLAIAELLKPLAFAVINRGSLDAIAVSSVASLAWAGVEVVGWVLLARGLARLNPRTPSQPVAGLSNIVVLCVLGALVSGLVQLALNPPSDLEPGLATLLTLTSILGPFQLLGWAYLLWIVIRGLGDTRRPRVATMTAAVGACLSGVLLLLLGLFGWVAMATQQTFDVLFRTGGQDLVNALWWTQYVLGTGLILVTFALGLGEPPIPFAPTAEGPTEADQTEEGVTETADVAEAASGT